MYTSQVPAAVPYIFVSLLTEESRVTSITVTDLP